MEVILENLQTQITLLTEALQQLANDFDAAQESRRGPQGGVGPAGRDGKDGISNVPGPRGEAGAPGKDARIVIGSISSGEIASASLRESNGTQVLDLVLPRGERGSDGAASTVAGPKGETGATGAPGRDGKNSTIAGPRGETGASGRDGIDGAAGKDGATPQITLGEIVSDDQASAELQQVGTASYVLNLSLPRGERGPAGSDAAVDQDALIRHLSLALEARFRSYWKADIAAFIHGHVTERHTDYFTYEVEQIVKRILNESSTTNV